MAVEFSENGEHAGEDRGGNRGGNDRQRSSQRARWRVVKLAVTRLGRNLRGVAIFSSLTRRIVVLNLFALVALLSGILYLNQFRAGLIDSRLESLLTQGEIIAVAIASSNSSSPDQMTLDADELLKQDADRPESPLDDSLAALDFPINPERVVPVLRRLITPTRTRARIFEKDGQLVIDSQDLYQRGDFLKGAGKPETDDEPRPIDRIVEFMARIFTGTQYPTYVESTSGKAYPEVVQALAGTSASIVRRTVKGELMVSVAVPIQKNRNVVGALLLSTQGGDIDAIVRAERLAILRVFVVAATVTMILSVLLAGTIAAPLRRLSAAADRVRRSVRAREEIPDFSARQDEIGHLSSALRDMTSALYSRLDAIESFAADVAHELKNPLTSLRSAVETLPVARTEVSRGRLLEVIQHDVRRLDRLISDISDASRLDAELAREDSLPVSISRLVGAVTTLQQELARDKGQKLVVEIQPDSRGAAAFDVLGHDIRLGQVLTNLLDNARSFSPAGGTIHVRLRREDGDIVLVVEDDGPGIRAENIERIFERFYTDRPEQEAFGNNSGLGLAISHQIVTAHRGSIVAENRKGDIDPETGEPRMLGARFTVRLPCA
ncbi:MAG: sensor histidine kinase [Ancalomicrobiaceae bacterium]|nr:sensor histidine kinase [Ancalomicrobiaceae bacterium]